MDHQAYPALEAQLRQAREEAEQQYGDLGLDGLAWAVRLKRCLLRRLTAAGAEAQGLEHAWAHTARADLILATACVEGSEAACSTLVRVFRPKLIRYAHLRLPVRNHGAFVDALMGEIHTPAPSSPNETVLGTYHGGGSLSAWLRILAFRKAADRKKRHDRERPDDLMAFRESRQDLPAERLHERSLGAALERVLERAPDAQLCVLWAQLVHGLSARLLSQLLNVKEPTLSKARGSLKQLVRRLMADVEVERTGPHLAQIEDAIRTWGARMPQVDSTWSARSQALEQALRAMRSDERRLLDLRIRQGASVQVAGPLFGITSDEVHDRVATALQALRMDAGMPSEPAACDEHGPQHRRLLDGFLRLLASLADEAD